MSASGSKSFPNSSSKWARLPWWANAESLTVRDAHSYQVCLLSHHDHNNLETARLIAAAPELLAALEAAYKQLDEDYGPEFSGGKAYWPTIRPLQKQIRSALDKARHGGDQPR